MLDDRSPLTRRPDFVKLWAGQTISELGSQITLIALPLAAILTLHATAFEVAVLSSFEFLPFLLFGLPAGVWVDRLPYRRVLIATDLARAAVLGSIPLAYALGVLTLTHLYAAGFAAGTFTVFFSLAWSAYLPALVERERLLEANGKLEATRTIAQTAGPAAAGGLVALLAAPAAILADALSFIGSAALIWSIRHRVERSQGSSAERHLGSELREGLRYVWRQPILRANLASSGLANFSFGVTWGVVIVFAVRELGLSAGMIGLTLAIAQACSILGAMFASRIAARIGVGPTFIWAMVVLGPASLVLATAQKSTAVPALIVGWGIENTASSITAVVGIGIRQALVPQRLLGRVVGATRTIILGVMPLGALAGGVIAATASVRTALYAGAAIAFVAFIPLALSPARGLHELPAVATD